jgi:putative PIN family toxin of toxin-antitoxin system
MRLVLDTNVLIAAMRSPTGASARLMAAAHDGRITALASATLFVEYEAVMTRPDHMQIANVTTVEVGEALGVLAQLIEPVAIHFSIRPEATDANDDMVLEVAVNGRADGLVTFETSTFEPAALRHGIRLMTPAQAWAMVKS